MIEEQIPELELVPEEPEPEPVHILPAQQEEPAPEPENQGHQQEEPAPEPVVQNNVQEQEEPEQDEPRRGNSTQRKNKRKREWLQHELERRSSVLGGLREELRGKEREVEELKRRVEGGEEVLRLKRRIRQMEAEWKGENGWLRERTIRERGEWERREKERCWEVGRLRARIAGLEEELEEMKREKVELGYARFVAHAANRHC